ncbi:thioredoxin family protein [Sphingobium sp. WW5]|uniref:Thioredoxin domain-containing protein n=1 Tax=Novosphingobium clariflavum TaxID=2029884 RepID=A0ABV6S5V2_9SPHN|nr:thioredoxin family protein [Novosphingobium clariflavum]RSU67297.1 thioredoxin [Sphingomonas sp. S-NIH.Pt3_0716]
MRYASSIAALTVLAASIPTVMVAAPAVAAAPAVRPFDQAAFDAAQKAGKPILVWVHAPWCPVCREQAKTIARVTAEPAYRDMQVFRIDYDTQKPLWQKFGATMQSTVIAFHGKRETARIAHETDDGKVSAVIHSAIA